MEELKIPEERNDPKQASGWPFSKKEWTEAWKQLEERLANARGYIF